MKHPWINLETYTITQIVFLLSGTILWNIAYFIIIRNAIRYKKMEMPFLAVCSNIAWEFAWAFLLYTDLGKVFEWGLRVWFFMDVGIFIFTVKYGAKQMGTDLFGKKFVPFLLLLVAWWIPVFYFFEIEGLDTKMGTTSAYMITVVMASLFVFNAARKGSGLIGTKTVAWTKFFGNLLMSVFVFLHHPQAHFLQLLTIAVFVLNIIYIIQVSKKYFANPPTVE
ncbi:transmembrane-type terpene cyclase [Algoriphagus antarcticus]|uniref:Uncharacterized protein n=1 Tax=Algoriphagus antarcticus TaxID=238540 RepID=A0A3E0DU13_9BACT|nr:hypothetical protein [Algoriphagus antarcticus]REG86355.1 hypothetical protein C8N25_11259 [Algoriphagus antarcticus]